MHTGNTSANGPLRQATPPISTLCFPRIPDINAILYHRLPVIAVEAVFGADQQPVVGHASQSDPYGTFAIAVRVTLLVIYEDQEAFEGGRLEEGGYCLEEGVFLVSVVGEDAVGEGGKEGEVACCCWGGRLEA